MFKLDTKLELTQETIDAPNLTDKFTDEELSRLGEFIYDGYFRDRQSRVKWEKRTEAAMDLAMQIQKDKNFPWPGCSNIAFPLVTIAVLQFHSRAYPGLLDGTDIVKCCVIGEDADGEKTARASRISTHMSWQVLEEDKSWIDQQDRLLINVATVGTAFKKSYHNASKSINVGELVLARDLVIDYWAKSVEECPRKTHVIPLFRNDIRERIMRNTFRDVSKEAWYSQPGTPQPTRNTPRQDNRAGVNRPMADETTPFNCLEQHLNIDLDQDGYDEPYIITIEETSRCVLRIVTGFDQIEDIERVKVGRNKGEIISIRALQYFTKYGFIPSLDGGIYDIGFGVLLGPLNESTNSIVNQLVDAGTMANTAGGFLGRGAKIRGGVYTFAPFQWQRVDSQGEDLSKSIFPLPVREPSAVLFQLLVLLINYTNRISGSTDPMVGENPGQNQPAETTRAVMSQGMKIFDAIFKRLWRAMKAEFEKLYVLNAIYMPARKNFGGGQYALREDYLGNPDAIAPAADPNIMSDQMKIAQVQALKQSAMTTPGYDRDAVERRFLKAIKIDAPDEVFKGANGTPPPKDPKIVVAEMRAQTEMMKLQRGAQEFAAQLMEEQRKNNAEIIKLQAEAAKLMADIEGDEVDRQINAINTSIGVLKSKNDALLGRIETILHAFEIGAKQNEQSDTDGGGVSRMAGSPDNAAGLAGPLAALAAGAEG